MRWAQVFFKHPTVWPSPPDSCRAVRTISLVLVEVGWGLVCGDDLMFGTQVRIRRMCPTVCKFLRQKLWSFLKIIVMS